uniref:TIL domain-containing protein n=1 Tax=Anopheles minimus TaxID=112268 RepID=A0A182WCJ3_9DIPT
MALRYIFATVLLSALMLAFVFAQDCTGPNEEYYNCTSPCRRNCSTLTKPLENCETKCVSGCFCKLGYFRRDDNACVKPWLCAKDPLDIKFPNRIHLEPLQ